MRPWIIILAAAFFLWIAVPSLAADSDGPADSTVELALLMGSVTEGTLEIETTPFGARVLIDGEFVGFAPVRCVVEAGKRHVIDLRLEGYNPETREVNPRAGRSLKIRVEMIGVEEADKAEVPSPDKRSVGLAVSAGYLSLLDKVSREVYQGGLMEVAGHVKYYPIRHLSFMLTIGYRVREGEPDVILDADETLVGSDVNSRIEHVPVELSTLFEIRPHRRVNPFLGIGAGYTMLTESSDLDVRYRDDDGGTHHINENPTESRSVFGWHLGGGIEIVIHRSYGINLSTRYVSIVTDRVYYPDGDTEPVNLGGFSAAGAFFYYF